MIGSGAWVGCFAGGVVRRVSVTGRERRGAGATAQKESVLAQGGHRSLNSLRLERCDAASLASEEGICDEMDRGDTCAISGAAAYTAGHGGAMGLAFCAGLFFQSGDRPLRTWRLKRRRDGRSVCSSPPLS